MAGGALRLMQRETGRWNAIVLLNTDQLSWSVQRSKTKMRLNSAHKSKHDSQKSFAKACHHICESVGIARKRAERPSSSSESYNQPEPPCSRSRVDARRSKAMRLT